MEFQAERDPDLSGLDFSVMLISDEELVGALVFLTPSKEKLRPFIARLVDLSFPPFGERASSFFMVSSKGDGSLLYEVTSSLGVAKVALTHPAKETAEFVRNTIRSRGSLPIVFGSIDKTGFALLDPPENYFVRSMAVVDNEVVSGTSAFNWEPFLKLMREEFDTFQ